MRPAMKRTFLACLGIALAERSFQLTEDKKFLAHSSLSSSAPGWSRLHVLPREGKEWEAAATTCVASDETLVSDPAVYALKGGATAAPPPRKQSAPRLATTTGSSSAFARFRPGSTPRERTLALWLLVWNSLALGDAILFTFRPSQNLNGYLVGEFGPHTLAMTRMLANCQLGLIASSVLVALTSREPQLKAMFRIMIGCTLGAFRAVSRGVAEGTIKAPWKTGYASLMTLPPLLLLSYFGFVY